MKIKRPIFFLFNSSILLSLSIAFSQSTVQSLQFAGPSLYPTSTPGSYELLDQSKLQLQILEFNLEMIKEDKVSYERIIEEGIRAYNDLLENCNSLSDIQELKFSYCSSFMKLRVMSQTTVNEQRGVLNVSDLNNAMNEFKDKNETLKLKISALALLQESWKGLENSLTARNTELIKKRGNENQVEFAKKEIEIYTKGQVNLKIVANEILKRMEALEREARQLTYKYFNDTLDVTTEIGKGLDFVNRNAQSVAEKLEMLKRLKKDMEFDDVDRKILKKLHFETIRKLIYYRTENGKRLVYFTKSQDKVASEWIQSIEVKTQLLSALRAQFCIPIGIPAILVRDDQILNRDFLKRGLTTDDLDFSQAVIDEESEMQDVLKKLMRLQDSISSQAGEKNSPSHEDYSTMMKLLHKVNSTFTWHNEVFAGLNVIKILRDQIQDEIDLRSMNCLKVRLRYQQKYQSTHEKTKQLIESFVGITAMPGNDEALNAIYNAGQIILARGSQRIKYLKLIKENPSLDPIKNILNEVDEVDPWIF